MADEKEIPGGWFISHDASEPSWTCAACGAIVGDRDTHRRFHESIEKAVDKDRRNIWTGKLEG